MLMFLKKKGLKSSYTEANVRDSNMQTKVQCLKKNEMLSLHDLLMRQLKRKRKQLSLTFIKVKKQEKILLCFVYDDNKHHP